MVYIPAIVRGPIYAVYAVLGVIVGAVQVAYLAIPGDDPLWLTVTGAVYLFLGGAIGYAAATNTPAAPSAESAGFDAAIGYTPQPADDPDAREI